jgi:hypothetical protein
MKITVKELMEDIRRHTIPVDVTGYSYGVFDDLIPRYKVGLNYDEVSAEPIVSIVNFYLNKKLKEIEKTKEVGEIVLTSTEDGELVAVTRQDEEGRILKLIWSKK